MQHYLSLVLILISSIANAQALRDINYNYLYNPNASFTFVMKPARIAGDFVVQYSLQLKDTTKSITDYTIAWEGRAMLSDKEGAPVMPTSAIERGRTSSTLEGEIQIPNTGAPKILVARIVLAQKTAWLFYTRLDESYPANNFVVSTGSQKFRSFIKNGESIRLRDTTRQWIVSYYEDIFPAAAPAFSEAQARVSKAMKSDSTFTVDGAVPFSLKDNGLYLFQRDTNAAEGFAFRLEDDYPRFGKLKNLAGPLVYICTKQEYDRLEMARGDKKAFDRIILNITSDTDRARTLMRNYFRRVELANLYFTSYKEGWKTDRGMIYTIFGIPDDVYKFNDREVWNYSNATYKASFDFVKSPSVFDPDNYVLIRNNKYKEVWYEVVDLWRNARF